MNRATVPKIALGFSLLTLCCSDGTGPAAPRLNEDALDSLFANFNPQYNYIDEPTTLLAHAVQVSVPGQDTWHASLGYVDSLESDTIGANSVFRVASTTKMFTATLILQLWEEGLLDLDSSFNYYLALDEAAYPRIGDFSGVTLRHLLRHRSGLPYISSTTFFDAYEYTDSIAQTDRMKYLFTDGEPEFEPNAQYAYRNSNYNILGLVIERVSGKPYHEVLQEKIYAPLGLTNTHLLHYDISPDDERIAHGYFRDFDGTLYHGSQAWAAGGLVSNVGDLSTFLRALVDGGLFRHQSTFDLMKARVDGSSYGMGMFVTHSEHGFSYGHGGAIFGYNTKLEYFPDLDTVVCTNMTFNGIDFVVVNWIDDFYYPVLAEIRRVIQ